MTTIADRRQSALVVIDVQTEVVANAFDRNVVIANINTLVAQAHAADVPVIWVQHADDDLPTDAPGWELAPELQPRPGDPLVHKNFRDAFEGTNLEAELERLDVGRLFLTGAQTDYCVRWTMHSAHDRGYDTVLVSDAHTTDDPAEPGMPKAAEIVAHTNAIWHSQDGAGRSALVAPTAQVTFAASSAH